MFIFRRQKTHFVIFRRFIFRPKKTSAFSFSFLFSVLNGRKKQNKNIKRKSVLWLRQCTAGRTQSHLQSHTAAVYIATRRAWVLWGSKHWAESADSVCCLCCCSRFALIAPSSMHIHYAVLDIDGISFCTPPSFVSCVEKPLLHYTIIL